MAEISTVEPDDRGQRFRLVYLDDSAAVYDRRSGRTHILDLVSAEVLRCLEADDRTEPADLRLPSIQRRVRQALQAESGELPLDVIEAAIERLDSAGLR